MMSRDCIVSNGVSIERTKLNRMKTRAYALEFENQKTNAKTDKKMIEEHMKNIKEIADAY